jgi:uncharacterized membrane protein (UPF0127 family)
MLKTIYRVILTSTLACFCATACKETSKRTVAPAKFEFKKEGHLSLFKADTDSLLAKIDIEIAETDYETQTGLMYRHSMRQNQGMLFIFEAMDYRSFYMKNTHISLDIIYLDHLGNVVSIQEHATPLDETSLPSTAPAQYVLEVNAGLAQHWSLSPGDHMTFTRD